MSLRNWIRSASRTRWSDRRLVPCAGWNVQAIKARGLLTLVECGPGKVLAGMVKRIDAELSGLAVYDPRACKK